MSEPKKPKKAKGDYEVGYGKPPRHSQYVRGQSGFKGHKHKKAEVHSEMIARIMNEVVEINGQKMTKFELAVHQTVNLTIKHGKPRDLKLLQDMMKEAGAFSEIDRQREMEAGADEALRKIFQHMDRVWEVDVEARDRHQRENDVEAELVMSCPHCGPQLQERWRDPDYAARKDADFGRTAIHALVLAGRERKRKRKR